MQIERHELPDGSESVVKRLFAAQDPATMTSQLRDAYEEAAGKPTLREIRQVQFDPDDPCPCGGGKKAKNCCAGRLLRRLAQERAQAEKALVP